MVYAFDADAGDPVCAKVFPGNVAGEVAYGSFLEETQLRRGILIGDKALRHCRQVPGLDDTRAHSDCSACGSELVNFVSTCITMRLVSEFEGAGLLDKATYSQVMADLRGAKRVRLEEGGEWVPARITKRAEETVRRLGLSGDLAPAKPKRGRPRKAKASDV